MYNPKENKHVKMVYILCWFIRYVEKIKQIRVNNVKASAIRIYAQKSQFKLTIGRLKKGHNLS